MGQGRDVISHCGIAQDANTPNPANKPASLQLVVVGEPWEMVVVDILKSLHLVKEISTSWWCRITLQSGYLLAHCQTRPVLRDDVFSLVGHPRSYRPKQELRESHSG